MFRKPSPILPDVPIYTFEWGFGDQFGGITNSAIERTNAFATHGNRRMVFLTADPNLDPKQRAAQFHAEGRFSKLVSIRNVWHELREMPDRKLRKYPCQITSPQGELHGPFLEPKNGAYRAERTNREGKVVRTDHFRRDGSIVVSDQHDLRIDGRPTRRITLFTSKGEPVGQWTNLSEFYFSWLDAVIGSDLSVLITDTRGIGSRTRWYDRDNVVKVQMLHTFHLDPGRTKTDGPLNPKWKNIVINSDRWDVLGVLTEDQRGDIARAQLDPGNLKILSNMYQGEVLDEIRPRPKSLGIQVSRLAEEKRVDHTIQAIAMSASASIDVYGFAHREEYEQELRDLIEFCDVDDRVVLRGYDRRARERFIDASFSLLPSLFEGQGIVLLESMAAGCVPIAYDVRYGPSSIIEHGVDGFLVPGGEVKALAEMIDHVTNLDDETLAMMRRNAVNKAKDYLPKKIVGDWGRVLREAIDSKPAAVTSKGSAQAVRATVGKDSIHMRVEVTNLSELDEWAAFTWKSRVSDLYGRIPAERIEGERSTLVQGNIPISRLEGYEDNVFDLFVDVRRGGYPIRLRVQADALSLPSVAARVEPYATSNANLSLRYHAPFPER